MCGLALPSDQLENIGAMEFLPDLVEGLREGLLHPRLGLLRELQRGLHAVFMQQGRGLMADAPDVFHGEFREVAVELPTGNGCQARGLCPF